MRWRSWAGWVLVVVTLAALTAAAVWRVDAAGWMLAVERAGEAAVAVGFTVVGALVVARRPDNRIGWLFCAVGSLIAVGAALEAWSYRGLLESPHAPGALVALWLASWIWVLPISLLFVWLPLLFPDGRLASPRWRIVALVATVCGLVVAAGMAMIPGEIVYSDVVPPPDNPYGLEGYDLLVAIPTLVALVIGGGCVLAAIASLLGRFRRAEGEARQQLTWLLYGVALPWLAIAAFALVPMPDLASTVLMDAGVLAVPVTLGVAILRHRLYAIDRLVSRTVGYLLVTGLLAGVYAGAALALGQVVGGPSGEASAPAVAGATLAVAGAFGPLRRRVQDVVDRRFDRARYDAQAAVTEFRGRLRDEVDLDSLHRELLSAVAATVEPVAASVWLRPEARAAQRRPPAGARP